MSTLKLTLIGTPLLLFTMLLATSIADKFGWDAEIVLVQILLLIGSCVLLYLAIQNYRHKKAEEDAEMLARIKENQKKNTFLQSLKDNTWRFPVESFCKKFTENFGSLQNWPPDEASYQRAKMLVETILTEHNVPQEYFTQYTIRNTTEQYLGSLWNLQQQNLRRETEQKLARMRAEESALDAKCTIYANYTGKEKTIHYCEKQVAEYTNIIRQCQQNSSAVIGHGNRLYDLSKQQESSWALHGGIADGIAGPGAGLAVAADVQRRNAAIQHQNAQMGATIARLSALTIEENQKKQRAAEVSLNEWQAKLDRANILLTQALDERSLLISMSPSVLTNVVSETGAIKFHVTLNPAQGLSIYGNVAAVVDGSIQVLIMENGQTVGTAICCLPFGGVTNQCVVEGICRNAKRSNPSQPYQLAFAPNHLWAVEKM